MSWMFAYASSFNQSLDNWKDKISKVTYMQGMFFGTESFNQPLNNWNVSNVTTMGGMFNGAISFNQSLNNWNVSNVTEMTAMFMNATSFNQPLNNWKDKVSNVTDISSMFDNAIAFNQPPPNSLNVDTIITDDEWNGVVDKTCPISLCWLEKKDAVRPLFNILDINGNEVQELSKILYGRLDLYKWTILKRQCKDVYGNIINHNWYLVNYPTKMTIIKKQL